MQVSPSLVSETTEKVMEEARAWQSRPLDGFHGVVFLDAMFVKIRHEGRVENRAVYVALGIDMNLGKDVLGLWMGAGEGSGYWLSVLTELRNRGLHGLCGWTEGVPTGDRIRVSESAGAVIHRAHGRASLNYATWQDKKKVATDLKAIYQATTQEMAEQELNQFEGNWRKYPAIAKSWREHWAQVTPFFSLPPEVRRIVYTTNAVESLQMSLRKAIKTRASFPSEEAAFKLLYLALRNVSSEMGHRAALEADAELPGNGVWRAYTGSTAARRKTKGAPSPPVGGEPLIPPAPPVGVAVNARTVLACKGSLRRAKSARPCTLRAVPAG